MQALRTAVLFGTGLLLWRCESHAQERLGPIAERERQALVALYQATNGPHWKNHDNWLSPSITECDWHGVTCGISGDGGWIVQSLDLSNNNLVGAVPEEIGAFTRIEYLLLAGNRLTGRLPESVLRRWEKGPLLVVGYAELIGVSEISLDMRTALYCIDYRAVLHANGSVQLWSEKCREKAQRRPKHVPSGDFQIFCEIKSGTVDRYGDAFGRLARLAEAQGFFEFGDSYWKSITHGASITTSVVKEGVRKSVENYAEAGPFGLWEIESVIRGVLADADWTKTERTKRCEWPTFRSERPQPTR